MYATKIAEIIDSNNIFFKEHRIISRDDCTDFSFKNLKRLFPCDDTMVLIVDDREDVWSDARRVVSPNLIKIEPYHYFETFEEVNQLPQDKILQNGNQHQPQSNNNATEKEQKVEKEQTKHEEKKKENEDEEEDDTSMEISDEKDDNDTHLYSILKTLKAIHHQFYSQDSGQDVKEILRNIKNKILDGCHIVFSGLIPLNTKPMSSDLWRLAESHGAKCYTDLKPTVTHLVAAKAGTDKVNKVLANPNIFLVNPSWFYDSLKFWKKADEEFYSVDCLPVKSSNTKYERPTKKQKKEKMDEILTNDEDNTPYASNDSNVEDLSDQEMASLIEQELNEDERDQ